MPASSAATSKDEQIEKPKPDLEYDAFESNSSLAENVAQHVESKEGEFEAFKRDGGIDAGSKDHDTLALTVHNSDGTKNESARFEEDVNKTSTHSNSIDQGIHHSLPRHEANITSHIAAGPGFTNYDSGDKSNSSKDIKENGERSQRKDDNNLFMLETSSVEEPTISMLCGLESASRMNPTYTVRDQALSGSKGPACLLCTF